MDAIADKCQKCDCQIWNRSCIRMAYARGAWRDTDRRWYKGPAIIETTRTCARCGWSQRIVRKRGKLDRVVSDAT